MWSTAYWFYVTQYIKHRKEEMRMKQELIIKAKQRWDMKDETTGKVIKGAKIFVDNGEVLKTPDKEGIFDTSFGIPYDQYDNIISVPALYEVDFQLKLGSKGQMTVTGIEYVGDPADN